MSVDLDIWDPGEDVDEDNLVRDELLAARNALAQQKIDDRITAQEVADALNSGSSDAEHDALFAIGDNLGLVWVENEDDEVDVEGKYVLPEVS